MQLLPPNDPRLRTDVPRAAFLLDPAVVDAAGRRPIDIADLVAWAVLKADESGSEAPAAVATLSIDEGVSFDEAEAPLSHARAMPSRSRQARLDPDAEAVIAAVRRMGGAAARLVLGQARAAAAPDWQGEGYQRWRRRNKLFECEAAVLAWSGVPTWVPLAVLRKGIEVAKPKYDQHGNARGVELAWVNRGRELQQARARYTLWRGALVVLQAALTAPPTPLSRHRPTGPGAAPSPWLAAETAETLAAAKSA